jgi:transposase
MVLICGIDVSSSTLEARIGAAGPVGTFANNAEGIALLAGFCREHGATLAVMEATGGYERLPYRLLWDAGVPSAVVHAHAVRCYAKAMGRQEKTDQLDAGMIAVFAAARGTVAVPPPSERQSRLRALVTRLRQLTEHRAMQQNQRRLVTEASVLADFDQLLALLTAQIRKIEGEVAELIDADPLWSELNLALREIKGVAKRTVARLMAEMPEIGTLNGKVIGKLAGLAPLADDSGKKKGPRHISGGRANVRSILFTITLCVRRYNPDFERFACRLEKAGKSKKAIRIALAHKLLTRLNAKARDKRRQFALKIQTQQIV